MADQRDDIMSDTDLNAIEARCCGRRRRACVARSRRGARRRRRRVARLRALRAKLTETLIWMTGSDDFSRDGKAGEGWAKARDELAAMGWLEP